MSTNSTPRTFLIPKRDRRLWSGSVSGAWAATAVVAAVVVAGSWRCLSFAGSKGSITPLHHDAMHNFFLQVVGTKRFRLYSPAQAR